MVSEPRRLLLGRDGRGRPPKWLGQKANASQPKRLMLGRDRLGRPPKWLARKSKPKMLLLGRDGLGRPPKRLPQKAATRYSRVFLSRAIKNGRRKRGGIDGWWLHRYIQKRMDKRVAAIKRKHKLP